MTWRAISARPYIRTLQQSLAAVAEFKGEVYGHGTTRGVIRFVQVDEDTLLIEGSLDGGDT